MKTFSEKIRDTSEYLTFIKEFDYNIQFLESFSDIINFNGRMISFMTADKVHFINTGLLDSAARTLETIKLSCSIGAFSDANTLIRKLRDDLMLYVYILAVVNKRQPFHEDDLAKFDMGNIEALAKALTGIRYKEIANADEKAVEAWLSNNVGTLDWKVKKKLSFENYMEYLKLDSNVAKVLEDYNLKEYWDELRIKLNNYVHNNGSQFTSHNLLRHDHAQLDIFLRNVNTRTSYITTFFLILIIMVDGTQISSTDMIDHLDGGVEPPEDCQYLIAPFIQEYIDKKLVVLHPQLKQFLRENNSYGMKIE